ncbi:hypothetical protein [Planotetraspora sp. GP83]|uniref:hypothetical protein n=1 Tax=Planotetraspora sp. GP83 TaxID=3156264 RepID=UPI0035199927
MSEPQRRIRMLSDEETVSFLVEGVTNSGGRVVSRAPVADPGRLALDLSTVESVIAIVSALFIDGPIIPQLLERLRSGKSHKVVFEGPLRKITIEGREGLTEEELKAAFRLVMGVDHR